MRIPFLAEPAAEQYRSQGTKPTMGTQNVQAKASDRDYLMALKQDTADRGGFLEAVDSPDVPPEEMDALKQQYVPQGQSGEPATFDDNINWLSDIAAKDTGKAGMAAKRILGTIRKYLGDEGMYGKPTQAP